MEKSTQSGWDIKLKYGDVRADALAKVLLSATVEIKADVKQEKTGYLFIEYRQRGKPSGIAVTTADFWAFEFLADRWLVIPTVDLKAIAKRIYKARGNRVRGGDNDNEGVLVPLASLLVP